jgi:hypothetical protein
VMPGSLADKYCFRIKHFYTEDGCGRLLQNTETYLLYIMLAGLQS